MIKEKQDNREFMKNAGRRDRILAELKRNGFRITNQRKLLVDIILSDECSCCKEIYYKAVHEDPSIGIATVYRMVKTLEEIGAIDRKNLYRISCEENCEFQEGCILVLKNKEKVKLSMEDFKEAVNEVLRRKGTGRPTGWNRSSLRTAVWWKVHKIRRNRWNTEKISAVPSVFICRPGLRRECPGGILCCVAAVSQRRRLRDEKNK